jgi:hypothetical protein
VPVARHEKGDWLNQLARRQLRQVFSFEHPAAGERRFEKTSTAM